MEARRFCIIGAPHERTRSENGARTERRSVISHDPAFVTVPPAVSVQTEYEHGMSIK
jgi:hypothetical protein